MRLLLVHPFPAHLVRSDPRLPPTRVGPFYVARELPAEVAGVPAHSKPVAVLSGYQIGAHLIFSRLIIQYRFGGAHDPFRGISRVHRGMHVVRVGDHHGFGLDLPLLCLLGPS